MRRKLGEVLMSIGAVGIILIVLISFDPRVREQVAVRWGSDPAGELTRAGQQARALTFVVARAAHDQSLAHTPLLLLVFAGTVLLLFMVRT